MINSDIPSGGDLSYNSTPFGENPKTPDKATPSAGSHSENTSQAQKAASDSPQVQQDAGIPPSPQDVKNVKNLLVITEKAAANNEPTQKESDSKVKLSTDMSNASSDKTSAENTNLPLIEEEIKSQNGTPSSSDQPPEINSTEELSIDEELAALEKNNASLAAQDDIAAIKDDIAATKDAIVKATDETIKLKAEIESSKKKEVGDQKAQVDQKDQAVEKNGKAEEKALEAKYRQAELTKAFAVSTKSHASEVETKASEVEVNALKAKDKAFKAKDKASVKESEAVVKEAIVDLQSAEEFSKMQKQHGLFPVKQSHGTPNQYERCSENEATAFAGNRTGVGVIIPKAGTDLAKAIEAFKKAKNPEGLKKFLEGLSVVGGEKPFKIAKAGPCISEAKFNEFAIICGKSNRAEAAARRAQDEQNKKTQEAEQQKKNQATLENNNKELEASEKRREKSSEQAKHFIPVPRSMDSKTKAAGRTSEELSSSQKAKEEENHIGKVSENELKKKKESANIAVDADTKASNIKIEQEKASGSDSKNYNLTSNTEQTIEGTKHVVKKYNQSNILKDIVEENKLSVAGLPKVTEANFKRATEGEYEDLSQIFTDAFKGIRGNEGA